MEGTSGMVDGRQVACAAHSADVLDSWVGVVLELALSFPQEKLYCAKVPLIDVAVLDEFSAGSRLASVLQG